MEENTLSVLKIAPGQHPQQVEIDNDLKALQQAVGGSIGASYPFEDPVAIVYNDDGKLMGLPLEPCPAGRGRADVRCHCRDLSGGRSGRGRFCIALPRRWRRSMKKNSINPKPFSLWARRLMVHSGSG